MKKLLLIPAFALLSLFLPLHVYAIEKQILSSSDATIEVDSSSTYGDENILTVGKSDVKKMFVVKFDLGSLPSNAQVSSATVTLNQTSASGASIVLKMYKVTTSWNEAVVSGTSIPDYNGGSGLTFGEITVGDTVGSVTYPQNLSDLIMWWLANKELNYGLAFDTDYTEAFQHAFTSREGGSNAPKLSVTYSVPDAEGPIISDITVIKITQSSATVTWRTDEAASGFVEYGTDTQYGKIAGSSDLTLDHKVSLSDLSGNTTYHVRLKSVDDSGNETISSDKTFKTKSDEKSEDQDKSSENTEETVPKSDDVSNEIEIPTNFKAYQDSEGDSYFVTLSWSSVSDASIEGFNIYRSAGDAISYVLLATVDSLTLTYRDTSVEHEQQYYYIIRSFKEGLESADSEAVQIHINGSGSSTDKTFNFWKSIIIFNVIVLPIFLYFYVRYKNRSRKVQRKRKT